MNDLSIAWADYLGGYPWDSMFTATAGNAAIRSHPISLCRNVGRAVMSLGIVARAFVGVEPHKLGGFHTHGLVQWKDVSLGKDLLAIARADVADALSRTGFNRVEPVKQLDDVAAYCTKYITKGRLAEFGLYGRNRYWQGGPGA